MSIDPNPKETPPAESADPPRAGIAKLNLQYAVPTPQALHALPEDVARRYNVLPLSLENNTLRVFMVNPSDIMTIENLSIYTRKKIDALPASLEDIKEAIDSNYSALKAADGTVGKETAAAAAASSAAADAKDAHGRVTLQLS